MIIKDVLSFGAKGDGIQDDTPFIVAAIAATPSGGSLHFPLPPDKYKITTTIQINKPIEIVGQGAIIQQVNPGQGGFQINSSFVILKGLSIQGPQYTTQNISEVGIQAYGTTTDAPLKSIEISYCSVSNWGMFGIVMKYVDGFRVWNNCRVSNINYAGIMGVSVKNGRVSNNTVDNIIGAPNAYGIAMTRLTTNSQELVSDPRSSNVLIDGNWVTNVPNWEGLDTHAGDRIIFRNNTVFGCARGIVVCDCPNALNQPKYAPIDCLVEGNNINSGKTDGTAIYGIVISGPSSPQGSPGELATGCRVIGNDIRGYGYQALDNQAAMYIYCTRGLQVIGNTFIESNGIGIGLFFNNYGFCLTSNTFQDNWSNARNPICIKIVNDYNKGIVSNSIYVRGTKTATFVMVYGLFVTNVPNNSIILSKAYSELAVTTFDPGNHITSGTPVVTNINPNTGNISGGTTVMITGSNLSGAAGITIGGVAVTNPVIISSNQITVVSPSHAAGQVDVVVPTAEGSSAVSLSSKFTYTS